MKLPAACRGTASVLEEIPTRIRVSAQMETPGLLVLADRWDVGWHCYLDGKSVPILVANHGIRGVLVPSGEHRLEFRYWPASFAWGLRLAGIAACVIGVWVAIGAWGRRGGGRKSVRA